MRNKSKIGVLLVILIAIIGVGCYFGLPMLNDKRVIDPTTIPGENKQELISIDTIKDLARTSQIKINTTVENRIHVDDDVNTGNRIDLVLESGNLYLVMGNSRSKITDFDNEVVMIKNANNDCSTIKQHILVLTEKGNLYKFANSYNFNKRFSDSIINKIKNGEDIKLNLERLNQDRRKVLAITEYYHNSSCKDCGRGDLVVYTDDEKFRIYHSMQEIKSLEKSEICGGPFNIYMTIYEDGTAKDKNGWSIDNKFNKNLVVKETFRTSTAAYILDHLNYLYTVKNEDDRLKVELYRDTKVLEFKKDGNNIRVTFESGHTADFTNWKYIDEY